MAYFILYIFYPNLKKELGNKSIYSQREGGKKTLQEFLTTLQRKYKTFKKICTPQCTLAPDYLSDGTSFSSPTQLTALHSHGLYFSCSRTSPSVLPWGLAFPGTLLLQFFEWRFLVTLQVTSSQGLSLTILNEAMFTQPRSITSPFLFPSSTSYLKQTWLLVYHLSPAF